MIITQPLSILVSAFFFLVQPLATSQEKHADEDARLEAFFKNYLDEEFRRQPLQATVQGDHRFDHLLDDVSAKARSRWTDETQKALKDLERTINYANLTRAGQIDFEILKHHLQASIWLAGNTRPFEEDPRVYNLYITDSVYLLLSQSTLPKPANVRNCAERMKQIPRIIAAAKESLKKASKVHTETAIKQTRGAIAFYEKEIFDLAGETPQLSILRDLAKSTVDHLRQYQKFLQDEVLPAATADWRLGKQKFAEKLKFELNSGIDSEEVLKEAEAEAESRGARDVRHRPPALAASFSPARSCPRMTKPANAPSLPKFWPRSAPSMANRKISSRMRPRP